MRYIKVDSYLFYEIGSTKYSKHMYLQTLYLFNGFLFMSWINFCLKFTKAVIRTSGLPYFPCLD